MKKRQNLKTPLLVMHITISSLALVHSMQAAAQTNQNTETQAYQQAMAQLTADMGEISAGVQNLRQEIKDLFHAGFKFVNQQSYQTDPTLSQLQQANSVKPNNITQQYTQIATQNIINNTLTQVNYAMHRKDQSDQFNAIINSESVPFKTYMEDNGLKALSGVQTNEPKNPVFLGMQTTATAPIYPANDSLYLGTQQQDYSDLDTQRLPDEGKDIASYLGAPQKLQNNMLNFTSVITPTAYDNTQLQDAQNYIKFATQDTVSWFPPKPAANEQPTGLFGQSFNFDAITSQSKKQQAETLYTLKQDPRFQRFAFNIRTLLALKSVSLGILNQLVAERTPVPGLGTQAGLSAPDGNPLPDASPLQVESYTANHRIENSSWYNSMQNASPATVQRNILIVLAEIEHQNYEAHLDRERLLAAIAAMDLNMQQQTLTGYMELASSDVNTAITDAINRVTGTPTIPAAATSTSSTAGGASSGSGLTSD